MFALFAAQGKIMATMIALVGEQPMPVLLPALYLKPTETILVYTKTVEKVSTRLSKMLLPSRSLLVDPYKIAETINILESTLKGNTDLVFNLTGGTKLMAIAAFALVAKTKSQFVYLQSEGKPPVLKQYQFGQQGLEQIKTETLPTLITAKDYLNAYLPSFRQEGFSKDEKGNLNIGGRFEKVICEALQTNGFEVLAGVRPDGVSDQIEIDLVIRLNNQVGIAEIKLGDREGKGPKSGIDQLSTAGGREYLGTYTSKFLILANSLPLRLRDLAVKRGVTVIDNIQYLDGKPLSRRDTENLVTRIKETLTR